MYPVKNLAAIDGKGLRYLPRRQKDWQRIRTRLVDLICHAGFLFNPTFRPVILTGRCK
jgi:hypothetical protein